MKKIFFMLIFFCFTVFSCFTHAAPMSVITVQEAIELPGHLLPVGKPEFQPNRGKTFKIPFQLIEPAKVTIAIYTADGDLVRELKSKGELTSGKHQLSWNGKDSTGLIVPDEAYSPVLQLALSDGQVVTQDSRTYSGGEILDDVHWIFRNKTQISYDLPAPSRVLIRAGIKEGPMMRAFTHWSPRISGRVVQRWDGYDADKIEYFAEHEKSWVLVMAYQLPEFSIIATGNKDYSYREYRKKRGWKRATVDFSKVKLHRNGVRLEREYSLPRGFIPRLGLTIKDKLPLSRNKLPLAKGKINLEITIPKEDRWVLEADMYEIGFFVDYKFQSEEEQGFVPMTWTVDTEKLKPGRHIATVQITGFGGYVVSKTIAFETQ